MLLTVPPQDLLRPYWPDNAFGHGREEDICSPTHSSSSIVFSDDGSRDTASSRSSVSSPESPVCSVRPATSLPSQERLSESTECQELLREVTKCKTLPPEQRQNPRRTSSSSEGRTAAPPPSLVRQSERKECFVACLVSFATQFVEAIWPLAACTPRTDTAFHGRGVLSLHCFITETLRRSRTSYSTLQVALFYLILIKEFVPKFNFTMEQPRGNEEFRAMQCGRRMFLTALILASKYLQDRNYSTRAWSKISGLRAQEIHQNEMEYCKRIKWALHFPKEKFDRWSYTVLRLSSPMSGPKSETVAQVIGWNKVLAKLDARLSETFPTREDFMSCQSLSTLLPTNFVFGESGPENRSSDTSKAEPSGGFTAKSVELQAPQTCTISEPPQPRIAKLPTPQSTPHPNPLNNFSTVSATPSMCAAMSHVRNQGLVRVTRDQCPPPQTHAARWTGCPSSSLSRMTSAAASPSESYTSEPPPLVHSRGSRSSSISSSTSYASTSSLSLRGGGSVHRGVPSLIKENPHSTEPTPRPGHAATQYLSGMISDLETCTSSPESWDQSSVVMSSPLDARVLSRSQLSAKDKSLERRTDFQGQCLTLENMHLKDWEAAATLLQLPSNERGICFTPGPRLDTRPTLSRSVSAAEHGDDVTPRAVCGNAYRPENVSPSTSHKRTHSKTNDLQDQVRQHLRKSLWSTDIPDRTINSSVRKIPSQPPTQTFGVTQFPVPTKGSEGHKRHCASQASAADRAASMLLADRFRGKAIR